MVRFKSLLKKSISKICSKSSGGMCQGGQSSTDVVSQVRVMVTARVRVRLMLTWHGVNPTLTLTLTPTLSNVGSMQKNSQQTRHSRLATVDLSRQTRHSRLTTADFWQSPVLSKSSPRISGQLFCWICGRPPTRQTLVRSKHKFANNSGL